MRSIVISLIVTLASTAPLLAQDSTRMDAAIPAAVAEPLYRDRHTARVLGTLFPGAGHLYAGEYLRGYGYYLRTVGSAGAGVLVYNFNKCMFSFLDTSCDPGPSWPAHVLGVALVGIGTVWWIRSAIDAPHAAERANMRHRRRHAQVTPLLVVPESPRSGTKLGVSIAW
jgi:hypothetical protein